MIFKEFMNWSQLDLEMKGCHCIYVNFGYNWAALRIQRKNNH